MTPSLQIHWTSSSIADGLLAYHRPRLRPDVIRHHVVTAQAVGEHLPVLVYHVLELVALGRSQVFSQLDEVLDPFTRAARRGSWLRPSLEEINVVQLGCVWAWAHLGTTSSVVSLVTSEMVFCIPWL